MESQKKVLDFMQPHHLGGIHDFHDYLRGDLGSYASQGKIALGCGHPYED